MDTEPRIHVRTLGNSAGRSELLVVLPGALLDGLSPALEQLAHRRSVMLIRYGHARTMSELVDAIAQAITDGGRANADVIGSSFGGWVAQCLLARHPHRIRRLILSHSFAIDEGDAPRFRIALRIWSVLPQRVLLALMGLRARRTLSAIRPYSEEHYLSALAHVRSVLAKPDALEAVTRQNVWMLGSLTPSMVDAAAEAPSPPVLILDSSDDPVIRSSARAHLRSRFPGAATHSFTGSGHVSAFAEPESYASLVERFLR